MGNGLLIDLESDEEKNHECGDVAENQRKRKFAFLGNSSKNPVYCFSSHKNMVMESVSFKSNKPFQRMVMKSYNIREPYHLAFLKPGQNMIHLSEQKSEVVLVNEELKEWKKHVGFTKLMNAPDVDEVQQREEAPSKLPIVILPFHFSRSPTRILWDPTQPRQKLQPPSGYPTDPQPHQIIEDRDEPPIEPRIASKRLDFDDPPQS
ncbi:hypothetical protein SUGI_0247160 [Cryptomeria japonica]|nr:hypothetical protein SUGI_0247160 [Cryptomeria japonica]